MPSRISTSDLVTRFISVHGKRYDYDRVDYKNKRTKVAIRCRKHGIFYQSSTHHLQGKGCPSCGREASSTKTRKGLEAFLVQAMTVHGNRYDYTNTIYKNAKTKVLITCRIHGVFEQLPTKHTQGQGCKKCATEKFGSLLRMDHRSFIRACKSVHGNNYSYKKTAYSGDHKKVVITCRIHGDFVQSAGRHKRGCGCPACGYSGFNPLQRATFYVLVTEAFVGYGISNYPEHRLSRHRRILHEHALKILNAYQFHFNSGYDAQKLENAIKKKRKARASTDIPGFKTEAVRIKYLDKLLASVERAYDRQNFDY